MPQAELKAQSLAEAELYLQVVACTTCRGGPVASACITDESLPDGGIRRIEVGLCAACGAESQLVFQIPRPDTANPQVINPTDKPSRIIDVGQWLILAGSLRERGARTGDARHARNLHLQAAECLAEALKFYDDPDNDLPPAEAFFCDASKERFRTHPQQFSRHRLLHEKSKLPKSSDSTGGRKRERPE